MSRGKYQPLRAITSVNLGPNGEYIPYEPLPEEVKREIGQKICDRAGEAIHDYIASQMALEASGAK